MQLSRTGTQERRAPYKLEFTRTFNQLSERFLKTLTDPALLEARVAESGAVRARGVQLRGGRQVPRVLGLDFDGERVAMRIAHEADPDSLALRLDGRDYVELTNPTALTSTLRSKSGRSRTREFLFARAVLPYETSIDLDTGGISTRNYFSDIVLFERGRSRGSPAGPRAAWIPRHVILRSDPARGVVIEDPRAFVTYIGGIKRAFLGFTQVVPAPAGSNKMAVLNRYVELPVDARGLPQTPAADHDSARPIGSDLSPRPRAGRGGRTSPAVTAKNGMFYENELGQIVVRTRFLLDFDDPRVRKLARGQRWRYAEQVFTFSSFEEFQKYDWRYALDDLFAFGGASRRGGAQRTRPLASKLLVTDGQLRENFDRTRVIAGAAADQASGKGLGPGTMPVRLRREGDRIYVSEARGAPEVLAGRIQQPLRDRFALADGEVRYITFDHEVRFFRDRGFRKRHYSATIKLFDHTLTNLVAYYADAIQPRRWYQRGQHSGIADLQHLYPVGRTIHRGRAGKVWVRVYAGTSDAHGAQYDFDVMKLLEELSPGSPRWRDGQIYRPGVDPIYRWQERRAQAEK